VLHFTVPAGLVCGAGTLGAYLLARGPANATTPEARTVATFTLLALGLVVLALVARPLDPLRGTLLGAMAGAAALVWLVPASRSFFALEAPPAPAWLFAFGVLVIAIPSLVAAVHAAGAGIDVMAAHSPGADGDRGWSPSER
jgi:cation-transporting ATPase E